jgi:hypothetical protein
MPTEKCDEDVYTYGESVGVYDMKKDEAEAYCQSLTAESDTHNYDWHYFGGRVHVKRLSRTFRRFTDDSGVWA